MGLEMLRVVLVFTAIDLICCQICQLDDYTHDEGLVDKLNGTYFVLATTGTHVLHCAVLNFVNVDNAVSATGISNDCCLELNAVNFHSAAISYEVDASRSTCPFEGIESGSAKLISETEDENCLIIYICRESRQGLFVICREIPQFLTALLIEIVLILMSILNIFLPMLLPTLYLVEQGSGCTFDIDHCDM